MSFISYAQNFEDVMLWRALKHIECGFYVDVGANDPEIDSVTRLFYEKGWRGINVEPVQEWFEKLQEERPRDINLQLAVGGQKGELTLYEIPRTGLSTTDKTIAERHFSELGFEVVEKTVIVESLTSICQRLHLAPIHFLKIDVEGAEIDVIAGVDFSIVRPWIIIVESTIPNSPVEAFAQWEPILLASCYDYVYFDGLNRFYIAQEHEELKRFFHAPPNFFDGFVLSGKSSAPFCSLANSLAEEQRKGKQEAESAAQAADQRAQQAESAAQAADQRAQQAVVLHEALLKSHSWRFTAPLRSLSTLARWFVQGSRAWLTLAPGSRPRRTTRLALMHLKLYVARRQRLKALVVRWLEPFPALRMHLRLIASSGLPSPPAHPMTVEGPEHLAPRARQIYTDLKFAIERRRKEQG